MQIFATDLDPTAIGSRASGRRGGIVADVGAERLARFFSPEGSGFRVAGGPRRIVFATHNILRDPPFTKLACSQSKLLIYLTRSCNRAFPLFHYALQPGGSCVGTSESATGHAELFTAIDRQGDLRRRSHARGGSGVRSAVDPHVTRRRTARAVRRLRPPCASRLRGDTAARALRAPTWS